MLVNDPHFISLCELGVDVYEIESLKNKIDLDMPKALGFFDPQPRKTEDVRRLLFLHI